ncbi:circadian clock protein KaiC [Halovivax asiaticus JCM 14624]|uniref:Circadian clock protein KaiC n=1 Tax=Halovivax asiaticus JCM 14624 TaxID=1227490 RepID=M0BVP9_9EURY|nr:KaiC domain-containing protein [Halovivax asiaticus]ELZ13749.1 circadian clock protein KaiC [Halovivax asiaticus JCM 14624]
MTEEELDDDWFERALEERDASAASDPANAPSDESAGTDPAVDEAKAEGDVGESADSAVSQSDSDGSASDSLFDQGFGDALEDVPTPDVGAGDGGPAGFADVDFDLGPEEPDFDEEVDSALPRLELGIDGLDRMIQGGIPERSLMVAIGSAGTGKTTLGLQFLNHGLENGERAVYITLEETRERVINSATEKGWRFDEFADRGDLAVVDVDPIEMATHLEAIQDELPSLIEDFGASRLVLDSVSLLEMMYDEKAKRRNEIYEFTASLKDAGVTALLTSEAAQNTAYASRHGIVEYLTDAVFVLQYVRPDDFRETRLAVEIQKIRDANHSREKKPYEITNAGISVHQQANLF